MSITPNFVTVVYMSDNAFPSAFAEPTLSTTRSALTTANALSSSSSSSTLSSFVGNTPSTVLFFLAMSVGVAIACLFIFFTLRYFVRSRYGLHVYPVSNRGMLFSALFRDTGAITYTPSNRELQEHLDYLRTHHFLRDEFLERRILSGPARRRRRRRRGRYAKMKKLTAEEVEKLFPKKLYAEWLSAGDDSSGDVRLMRVDVVHEQSSDVSSRVAVPVALQAPVDSQDEYAVVEMHEMHDLRGIEAHEDAVLLGVLLGGKGELHFDSGTCAICLETFEEEDIVRGLICGHVFHAECVDPWLIRRRACCAICKRDYYKEENADGNGVREMESTTGETTGENGDATGNAEAQETSDNIGTDAANTDATTDAANTGAANATDPSASTPNANSENGTAAAAGSSALNGAGVRSNSTSTIPYRPTRDDDDDLINYDALRTDPNLQALLQELIPLSERVRVILEEHSDLNLEERGREIADQKYSSIWKRIFWRLMGITREDLFHWAVIQVYQREQRLGNTRPAQDTQTEGQTGGQNSEENLGQDGQNNGEDNGDPDQNVNQDQDVNLDDGRDLGDQHSSIGNRDDNQGASTTNAAFSSFEDHHVDGPTDTTVTGTALGAQSELEEVDISQTHEVAARQV